MATAANRKAAEQKAATIRGFEQGEYPYLEKLDRSIYETEKSALQVELLKVQHWAQETGQKLVLLFEGRDGAGTADAPWTVIRSNDKKRARLTCMRHFLSLLDYPDKDTSVATPPDPLILHQAETVLNNTDHILASSLHPRARVS